MGKKKNNSSAGCGLLLIVAFVLGVYAFRTNPIAGIPLLLVFLAMCALVIYAMKPKRCELCNNVLECKTHIWQIEGVKKRVCVHCNQSLARKKSRVAMRQFK